MSSKYYDLDAILAEEELLPCTALFDFSHLGHLDDEDNVHSINDSNKSDSPVGYLKEDSKIKMPLWAMKKWSQLGYVNVRVPRHFNTKARERLEADSSAVDLRKRNTHYFLSGHSVVTLLEQSATPTQEQLTEATALRRTLLASYTGGARLRQTLDWSWSSVNDDVSHYLQQLTALERHLFRAGASATGAHAQWKAFGSRMIAQVVPRPLPTSITKTKSRPVSPDQQQGDRTDKRQRIE